MRRPDNTLAFGKDLVPKYGGPTGSVNRSTGEASISIMTLTDGAYRFRGTCKRALSWGTFHEAVSGWSVEALGQACGEIYPLTRKAPYKGEEPEQPGDEARGRGRLVATMTRRICLYGVPYLTVIVIFSETSGGLNG
jgi:hypothetical protein